MTRSALRIVLSLLCVGIAICAAAQTPGAPLRLSLECQQKPELAFRYTIHNVSNHPAAAVIGIVLANDKKYLPGPLHLTVRRAGMPDVDLTYVDPTGAIAGRLDPWLVTLPASASYSAVVPARYFLALAENVNETFSAPATLQLRLTTQKVADLNPDMIGLQLIRVWIGTLVSDRLQFPRQCRPAPGRG